MTRTRIRLLAFSAIVALLAACGGAPDPVETSTVTVNVTGGENGTVTVNGTEYTEPVTVESGADVTVTATANAGYVVEWSGACAGTTSDTCTLSAVEEDQTVGVAFVAEGGGGGDGGSSVSVSIAATEDDAEEFVNGANTDNAYNVPGAVVDNTNFLDFGWDDNFDDQVVVGLRFDDVAIPAGATITDAYVQFTASRNDSLDITYSVMGQLAANPGSFADTGETGTTYDITSRVSDSSPSAPVTPAAWTAGQRGEAERFTGLEGVVQAIVDQEGWTDGDNAIVLVVERTSGAADAVRQAYDFRNGAATAPELVVEYTVGAE